MEYLLSGATFPNVTLVYLKFKWHLFVQKVSALSCSEACSYLSLTPAYLPPDVAMLIDIEVPRFKIFFS